MEFEYKEIYRHPVCICLNLTDNCNLACKYCFVQQKPHYMTIDVAKKAVDWIVSNLEYYPKDKKADISFFGGEPMLMYDDIIVPLTLYIKEKYPNKVQLNITTNGTLLNKKRIDFLYENDIKVLLSIDGDKETQDFNRPKRDLTGSFDLVSQNIPYLLEKFPNTTFRGTLYQDTVKNTYQNYKYAQKMGFKNIFFCPNAREQWTEEHVLELEQELSKISVDFILTFLSNKWPIHFNNLDKAFRQILEHDIQAFKKIYKSTLAQREVNRCGIGSASASISYCGDIFSCQEQDSRDTNDFFYIGNIFNGIDKQQHLKILKEYHKEREIYCYNKELCKTCLLRTTCYNDTCISVSYDLYKDFFIRPEIDCLYDNFLIKNAIKIMEILVFQDKNDIFKQYLDILYKQYWKEE